MATLKNKYSQIDISQLGTSTEIGGKPIEQVLNSIHYGSPELRCLLVDECDLIFECKVCRSLFRDVPRLISHKQLFCSLSYLENRPVSIANLPEEVVEIVESEASVPFESLEASMPGKPPRTSRPNLEEIILRLKSSTKINCQTIVDYNENPHTADMQTDAVLTGMTFPTHENFHGNISGKTIKKQSKNVSHCSNRRKTKHIVSTLKQKKVKGPSMSRDSTSNFHTQGKMSSSFQDLSPEASLVKVESKTDLGSGVKTASGQFAEYDSKNSQLTVNVDSVFRRNKKHSKKPQDLGFDNATHQPSEKNLYPCPFCSKIFCYLCRVKSHLHSKHSKSAEEIVTICKQLEGKTRGRPKMCSASEMLNNHSLAHKNTHVRGQRSGANQDEKNMFYETNKGHVNIVKKKQHDDGGAAENVYLVNDGESDKNKKDNADKHIMHRSNLHLTNFDHSEVDKLIDVKNTKCLQCDKSYSLFFNLKNHVICEHLKWTRFKCRLCNFLSYYRSDCFKHLRKFHRKGGANLAKKSWLIINLLKPDLHAGQYHKSQIGNNRLSKRCTFSSKHTINHKTHQNTNGPYRDQESPSDIKSSNHFDWNKTKVWKISGKSAGVAETMPGYSACVMDSQREKLEAVSGQHCISASLPEQEACFKEEISRSYLHKDSQRNETSMNIVTDENFIKESSCDEIKQELVSLSDDHVTSESDNDSSGGYSSFQCDRKLPGKDIVKNMKRSETLDEASVIHDNYASKRDKKFDQAEVDRAIDINNTKCLLCGKSYTLYFNLRNHVICEHLNWTRFKCGICEFKSYYRCDCVRHLKKCHSKNVPNLRIDKFIVDMLKHSSVGPQKKQTGSITENLQKKRGHFSFAGNRKKRLPKVVEDSTNDHGVKIRGIHSCSTSMQSFSQKLIKGGKCVRKRKRKMYVFSDDDDVRQASSLETELSFQHSTRLLSHKMKQHQASTNLVKNNKNITARSDNGIDKNDVIKKENCSGESGETVHSNLQKYISDESKFDQCEIERLVDITNIKCLQCGKAYSLLRNVRKHVVCDHLNWTRFKCSMCDFQCYFKSNCIKHIQQQHMDCTFSSAKLDQFIIDLLKKDRLQTSQSNNDGRKSCAAYPENNHFSRRDDNEYLQAPHGKISSNKSFIRDCAQQNITGKEESGYFGSLSHKESRFKRIVPTDKHIKPNCSDDNKIYIKACSREPLQPKKMSAANQVQLKSTSNRTFPIGLKCSKIDKLIDNKLLRCLKCGRYYSLLYNLRNHIIKKHLRWSRFKCRMCSFKSYYRFACVKHLQKNHGKDGISLKGRSWFIIDLLESGTNMGFSMKTKTDIRNKALQKRGKFVHQKVKNSGKSDIDNSCKMRIISKTADTDSPLYSNAAPDSI